MWVVGTVKVRGFVLLLDLGSKISEGDRRRRFRADMEVERLCGAEGAEREREKSNGGGRLLTLAQNVDVSFVN